MSIKYLGGISCVVFFASGCGSDARSIEEGRVQETDLASETVSVPDSSAPLPAVDAELRLEFSLEAKDDEYTPWLLSVVAVNETGLALVDHETRVLERWTGDMWEQVAVVPFNLMTPGELVACAPGSDCEAPAVDAPLPPLSRGQERLFRVRPLEDGTYRMNEQADRGYSVGSNQVVISGGMLAS